MKRFVVFLLLSLALCVPVLAEDMPPDDMTPPAASDVLEPPSNVPRDEGEELPPAPDETPPESSPAPTDEPGELGPDGEPVASPEPESALEPSLEPTSEPTPAPHLVWDTPFSEYTVTEGLLLLLFMLFCLCIVFVAFK